MYEILHSQFWILLAKSLLAIIMFAFGAIAVLVLLRAKEWHEMLMVLETECDIARDAAMMQATIARSQLSELQERMKRKEEKAEIEVVSNLIKQAMPVVTMFMNKETNLLKWGFAGAKLVRSAFEYFSEKEKN